MKSLSFLVSAVLFFNAVLMFFLEPMVGRMLLPLLGGTPVVWNTCVVFFQMTLLAGYAAAHAVSTRLRPGQQLTIYVALQAFALLVLPLHVPEVIPLAGLAQTNPVLWLFGLLTALIGLPFFCVALTGPLLQKWFSASGHASARDPYYLYAASNAGSLLALLAYPLLSWLIPGFGLARQAQMWAVGYGILVAMVILLLTFLDRRRSAAQPLSCSEAAALQPEPPTVGRRIRWVVLACLPSSLMLGVTTYFSTEIAPVPLLWVLPLALYLLTFTLVFAPRPLVPRRLVSRVLPLLVLPLVLLLAVPYAQPLLLVAAGLHLGWFFLAALYCHGLLAADRPASAYLTDFYLWLAIGGVVGGLFNSLLAPLLFKEAIEYPLAVVLICLTRWYDAQGVPVRRIGWQNLLLPLAIAGLTAAVILGLQGRTDLPLRLGVALVLGPSLLLCTLLLHRPLGFALSLTAVLLASRLDVGEHGYPLYTTRSYFGVLHVTMDREGRFHQLVHGRTIHGRQSLDPAHRRVPLSYYDRTGPAGHIFQVFQERHPAPRVAVIGLGAGDLAGYARAGEQWTFYEIDPAVAHIATNPDWFTFLPDCPAPCQVVLGDGRLRLREAADGSYDLLILDAFSSDAIPTHLLTREAMQDYLRTLSPDGWLAMHISNRYLDLKPVVANLADASGLQARYQRNSAAFPLETSEGIDSSEWVVLARHGRTLRHLVKKTVWDSLPPCPDQAVWTDDSSSILDALAARILKDEP